MNFKKLLSLPEAVKITDLEVAPASAAHAQIIQKKRFLKQLYTDFYHRFKAEGLQGKIVELGSGGGFIKQIIPQAITSDLVKLPTADRQFSALQMPFAKNSVGTLLMLNVFHHLGDPLKFLQEASRVLQPGGKIMMIEPANTWWSRRMFKNWHHENFNPQTGWQQQPNRLAAANDALAWIILSRDRQKFVKLLPQLKITKMELHTPLLFLLSGGLSYRQFVPNFTYRLFKWVEYLLQPLNNLLAIFMTIIIEKK